MGPKRSRNKRNLVMLWGRYPQAAFSVQRGLCEALGEKSITAVKGKYVRHKVVSGISHPTIRHCLHLNEFLASRSHSSSFWGWCSVSCWREDYYKSLSEKISVAGVKWVTSSSEGNTLYPASHCCCFLMWWVTVVVTSLLSQTNDRCDVFWSDG